MGWDGMGCDFIIIIIIIATRGQGGNEKGCCIIYEELGFLKPELLMQTSAIWAHENASVIAISSPGEGRDSMSALFNARDPITDKRVFKTVELGFACIPCMRRGQASKCVHKQIDHWKSGDKLSIIKQVMAQFGDDSSKVFETEILGIQQSHILVGNVFSVEEAKYFSQFCGGYVLTKSSYVTEQQIFVFVDPNGGSDEGVKGPSEYAMVGVMYDNANLVIVCEDACPSAIIEEVRKMVELNIWSLRKKYPHARIVIMHEAQGESWSAQEVFKMLKGTIHGDRTDSKFEPIDFISTRKDRLAGVSTAGPFCKSRAVDALHEALRTRKLKRITDADFITTRSPRFERVRDTNRQVEVKISECTDLINQIISYRKERNEIKDEVFGRVRVKYSGKGNGGKDDRVTALMFAIRWCMDLTVHPTWKRYTDNCSRGAINPGTVYLPLHPSKDMR